MVETTPVVFKGKVCHCEWVRKSYKGNELGENYFRLVNVSTGKSTSPFAKGQVFASAFVDGDTIYVYNGTYYEQVTINITINLIGENNSYTIIDGERKGNVVTINSDFVNVSNFLIRKSGTDSYPKYCAGIDVRSSYCNIQDNYLVDNRNGIALYKNSNHTTLVNNRCVSSSFRGIYFKENNDQVSGEV